MACPYPWVVDFESLPDQFSSTLFKPMIYRLSICLLALTSVRVFADIPDKLEPEYSEAVLSFNAHEYAKSLALLDELIKKSSNTFEFYELQALDLKSSGQDVKALSAYLKLIELRKANSGTTAQLSAYHFELAMIYARGNQFNLADPHFEFAKQNGFNVPVCEMYLGLSALSRASWAAAEEHFKRVAESSLKELYPAAHFYLGQIYLKMGSAPLATDNFIQARSLAQDEMSKKDIDRSTKEMATQIFKATDQALAPYDRGQFFGNIALLMGYDSNILTIPATVSDPAQVSGKKTTKAVMMFGLGYATSSLAKIQFVPSYRVSYNHDFNSQAKGSEYISNAVSLYTTYHPLARLSWGLKGEMDVLFKNNVDPTSGAAVQHLYSTTESYGPYARYHLGPRYLLGAEFFFEPAKYNGDPSSGVNVRNGTGTSAHAYLQNDRGDRFLNPSIGLRHGDNGSHGSEYNSSSNTLELGNEMNLSPHFNLSETVSLAKSAYSERPEGERDDTTMIFQALSVYRFRPSWSWLSNVSFTDNASNLATSYSYTRIEISTGVSYSL